MELDKRIKEGKRPLTCFDIEQAMQFIGKQCYFSDDATDFMDLDKADGDSMFYVAELQNVWTAEEYCFADQSNDWRYILPVEFVKEEKKEPEKKYRPYSLTEWINQHEIGEVIHYRSKSEGIEAHIMYMGTYHHKNRGTIVLGVASYTLDCLFEEFEIEINSEWQPFGVIEE